MKGRTATGKANWISTGSARRRQAMRSITARHITPRPEPAMTRATQSQSTTRSMFRAHFGTRPSRPCFNRAARSRGRSIATTRYASATDAPPSSPTPKPRNAVLGVWTFAVRQPPRKDCSRYQHPVRLELGVFPGEAVFPCTSYAQQLYWQGDNLKHGCRESPAGHLHQLRLELQPLVLERVGPTRHAVL